MNSIPEHLKQWRDSVSSAYITADSFRSRLLSEAGVAAYYQWDGTTYNKKYLTNDGEPYYIDITELSVYEMEELGFDLWCEERNLWLIPLWLLPIIKKNIEVVGINGEVLLLSEIMKNPNPCFSCIPYGIIRVKNSKE